MAPSFLAVSAARRAAHTQQEADGAQPAAVSAGHPAAGMPIVRGHLSRTYSHNPTRPDRASYVAFGSDRSPPALRSATVAPVSTRAR
jgi:hypothetical protein